LYDQTLTRGKYQKLPKVIEKVSSLVGITGVARLLHKTAVRISAAFHFINNCNYF